MTAEVERRGDWGGQRQLDPSCIVVGERRSIPVCPLCAKQLLHTEREHDLLEAAAMKEARNHA